MQRLWLLEIEQSETFPKKEAQVREIFLKSLTQINNIRIPRCIVAENAVAIELHGFCEPSQLAYGAVIYAESYSPPGYSLVRLISSKSRVAPIKSATIPTLERGTAIFVIKMMRKLVVPLKLGMSEILFWCDSVIGLSRINTGPSTFKTFVANRVVTIQDEILVEIRANRAKS